MEKSFIRALTDLKDEERKNNYLLGRKELDISEEVEKIEIDLRKSTSQLAIKREFASFSAKNKTSIFHFQL